ncbi:hypothetical protein A1O7_05074, partial [Cladophialophora yegresii CBS 114405]
MPAVSPYPKLHIPDVNLWDFHFSRSRREYPDHESELLFLVSLVIIHVLRSYAMIQLGPPLQAFPDWRKGIVVALFSPNDVNCPVVMWGPVLAGDILSLINSGYTASEIEFPLVNPAATSLVSRTSLLPVVLVVTKEIGF